MRKKLAGILAVLMILCMSTTVFASTSPTSDDVIYENITSSATVAPGQSNVNVSKVTKEVYEEAKKETSGSIVSMAEVKLGNIANTDLTKGVSVTIAVSTLKSDDDLNTIRIMHKRSSDGKWEIIKPTAVDPINKTVTLTLYEFSPMAIVRYESGKAPNETQNKPAGSTTPQVNPVYEQVSSTVKTLDGEKIIKVTKTDQAVYEEAVKETTGAVVSMANISLNNVADADLSKGVVVSISVSTLTADDSVNTIRLLHKRSNDNKWEIIIPTSVNPATKVVTATFYDFSPVAVVRYAVGNAPGSTQYVPQSAIVTPGDEPQVQDPADEPDDPADYGDDPDYGDDDYVDPDKDQNENGTNNSYNVTNSNNTTTTIIKKTVAKSNPVHVSSVSSAKTSPKTGASMPVLPAIAMFSLMGIAYCGKKAKSL